MKKLGTIIHQETERQKLEQGGFTREMWTKNTTQTPQDRQGGGPPVDAVRGWNGHEVDEGVHREGGTLGRETLRG